MHQNRLPRMMMVTDRHHFGGRIWSFRRKPERCMTWHWSPQWSHVRPGQVTKKKNDSQELHQGMHNDNTEMTINSPNPSMGALRFDLMLVVPYGWLLLVYGYERGRKLVDTVFIELTTNIRTRNVPSRGVIWQWISSQLILPGIFFLIQDIEFLSENSSRNPWIYEDLSMSQMLKIKSKISYI